VCGIGHAVAVVDGELHAAVHAHEVDDPRDLVGPAFSHLLGEVALEPAPVRGRCRAEKVDQPQRALALPDFIEELPAVALVGAEEVQQVVPDLERCAQVEAEAGQLLQVHRAA
jgi:hypothetical protein